MPFPSWRPGRAARAAQKERDELEHKDEGIALPWIVKSKRCEKAGQSEQSHASLP